MDPTADGNARLISENEVEVAGRRLIAKDIVIATGSRTSVPPIAGLQEAGYLDHRTFLEQDAFPASLLILGGGYIGIEFAQIFRRFGSTVTVVEMLDEIVNKEDADVIARVREVLGEEEVAIRTGWAVKAVRVENGRKIARIENKIQVEERISCVAIAGGEPPAWRLPAGTVAYLFARVATAMTAVWVGGIARSHVKSEALASGGSRIIDAIP